MCNMIPTIMPLLDYFVKVLASYTDPIGKFLRDLGVSASDAIRLNIMPYLDKVCSQASHIVLQHVTYFSSIN